MIPALVAQQYTVFAADIPAYGMGGLAAKGYTCSGQGILEMEANTRRTLYNIFHFWET